MRYMRIVAVLSLVLSASAVGDAAGQTVASAARVAQPRPMPDSVMDVGGVMSVPGSMHPISVFVLRHLGGVDQICVTDLLTGTVLMNTLAPVVGLTTPMSVAQGTHAGLSATGNPGVVTANCLSYTCDGPADCILKVDYSGPGNELWQRQLTLQPGDSYQVFGPPALGSMCTGACSFKSCN